MQPLRRSIFISSWLILLFLVLSQKCKESNPFQCYAEILMEISVETLFTLSIFQSANYDIVCSMIVQQWKRNKPIFT